MKHIKEYNNWTTTATDNVDINYGDKPQLSEEVKSIINYIENNEYNFYHTNTYEISFNNVYDGEINRIEYSNIDRIEICIKNGKKFNHYITKEEKNYLDNFFKELDMKDKLNKNNNDTILKLTDPATKASKKYNL